MKKLVITAFTFCTILLFPASALAAEKTTDIIVCPGQNEACIQAGECLTPLECTDTVTCRHGNVCINAGTCQYQKKCQNNGVPKHDGTGHRQNGQGHHGGRHRR